MTLTTGIKVKLSVYKQQRGETIITGYPIASLDYLGITGAHTNKSN